MTNPEEFVDYREEAVKDALEPFTGWAFAPLCDYCEEEDDES